MEKLPCEVSEHFTGQGKLKSEVRNVALSADPIFGTSLAVGSGDDPSWNYRIVEFLLGLFENLDLHG